MVGLKGEERKDEDGDRNHHKEGVVLNLSFLIMPLLSGCKALR